jgi:hypothetical protein
VNYTRRITTGSTLMFQERRSYDAVVPIFEILAQADFRPVRHLSVAPYYGIRSGTLTVGAALRIHFIP